jgi:DNA-binding beta-propeller fold protein YncE
VAGVDSTCDCALQDCDCVQGDGDFARSSHLHNPASITITPDGSLYIADQLNLRIRKVFHSLPSVLKSKYQVADPDTNQLYIFDENGRHLKTVNVITGATMYTFSYSNRGKLITVSDINRNDLIIDYSKVIFEPSLN